MWGGPDRYYYSSSSYSFSSLFSSPTGRILALNWLRTRLDSHPADSAGWESGFGWIHTSRVRTWKLARGRIRTLPGSLRLDSHPARFAPSRRCSQTGFASVGRIRTRPAPATQLTSQPTNKATKQPSNQPTNQSTNQPTNQSTDQPITQSTNQPTNQTTNRPTNGNDQPTRQPPDQPTNRPTSRQPTNQPTNQPINQPTD